MVNGIIEGHKFYLGDQDWKCFNYLCRELKTNITKRVEKLIKDDLKKNEVLILRGMDNQKDAIKKRKQL